MSLIYFHIVLISSSIVFAAGFGGWEILNYSQTRILEDLGTGIMSLAFAVAMTVYLILFIRKHKRS